MLSEFTGKDESELGGFPVNSPDCMVNDQSVNHSWKTLLVDFTAPFINANPRGKLLLALSTTSSPGGKILVRKRFKMQPIFNQR